MSGDGRGSESVQVRRGELSQRLAQEVDGREPPGPQHQGKVVGGGSGAVGELGGGLGGSGSGVLKGHGVRLSSWR